MPGDMGALGAWLRANQAEITTASAALGVLVAIVGVAAAIYYAILTRRLWQATRAQADLTKGIAEETKRQAGISQSVFEASHRPYIELTLPEAVFVELEWYRFKLHLANRGSTPAVDLTWRVQVTRDGVTVVDQRSAADRVVFPQQARDFFCVNEKAVPGNDVPVAVTMARYEKRPPVAVDVQVEYVGPSGRRYFTRMSMQGNDEAWTVTAHDIGWLNTLEAESGSYGVTPG
jgi:hypothetical protein